MDLFMVIFRIIHILAGIIWVGASVMMVLVVGPTARRTGPQAGPFMMNLAGYSVFPGLMMYSAILTVVAGLVLYDRVTDHFRDGDYMSSGGGIVLSIGVVAGLLAFGHGFMTLSKFTKQQYDIARSVMESGGTPNQEQAAEMMRIQDKIRINSQISLILMLISVVGMSAARYV
jgi:uncharacterized membrane protein